MGLRIWATVWLTLQLACNAACNEVDFDDSERCPNIEEPEPVIDRALLQASVGKHRVSLPDGGIDEAKGSAPLNAPDAALAAAPVSRMLAHAAQPAALQSQAQPVAQPAAAATDLQPPAAAEPAAVQLAAVQPAAAPETQPAAAQPAAAQPAAAQPAAAARPLAAVWKADGPEGESAAPEAGATKVIGGLEPAVLAQSSQEVGFLLGVASSAKTFLQRIVKFAHGQLPESIVNALPTLETDLGAVIGLVIATCLIWGVLVFIVAGFYRSQKTFTQAVSSRPEQDFNDWTSGPFDVSSDWKVCCWSVLCPCIRWADNMDMMGIVGFWVGLALFCGTLMLNAVPGGMMLWCIASLLWMSFRQQVRQKFDMEQNTFRTFLGDCALYCCCFPCAIAQEARHIEEACRADHKAVRKFIV